MNNQEERFLKTDDIVQAGRTILSHLGIFAVDGRYQLASHLERANYKAVKNWLTKYQPTSDATNL